METGTFDGASLDGLNVVLAIHIPPRMSEGEWRVAPYWPADASEAPRRALSDIFLGRAGPPMARVAAVVVEGITGADGATEIWIRNVKHLACRAMASAIGRRGDYRDHGFEWNHAGKNAHYGPFDGAG